jgi:GGDEF domain-containing protein
MSQAESDRWIEDLQGVLAGGLRSFDVLERTGTTSFRALVPDPDGDAATQLVVLSQRASEMLGAAGPAAEQVRIRTGYASFPGDGDDVESLERRAAATAEAPRP